MADPLNLQAGPPVVTRRNLWERQADGSFRCGDVLIRCDERTPCGGYTFERWFIYRVGPSGELTRVHPKSRPYGYGHAGQAKIGAARMGEPVEWAAESEAA